MDAYVIDSGILEENLRLCRAHTAGRKLYAVVKGDGYGLGLEDYARFLIDQEVAHFAITEARDAVTLRRLGAGGDILLLRPLTEEAEIREILGLDVTFALAGPASAEVLSAVAEAAGVAAKAHIYMDSGMGREGFSFRDKAAVVKLCESAGPVTVTGVYTHFPSAACPGDTRRRFGQFMHLCRALEAAGWQGERHCCGSQAALRFPEMQLDAVRLGSALLGRLAGGLGESIGLRPVGYIDARIAAVKSVATGESLGYEGGFKAKRPSRVALLEVGYYHGYDTQRCRDLLRPRDYLRASLSPLRQMLRKERREALVQGQRVAVLGQTAMQNTLLDVTDCPCQAGDRAVLPCSPLMVRHLPRHFL